VSGWATDGLARWWRARRHRGHAVACPLCDHAFDAWDADGRCWRCGGLPRHRAAWAALAARPELLGAAERVVHLSPQYGLRNRIARESGFEYVTADADADRANIVPALLPAASFDGAVLTEERDRAEAERLVRPGGWVATDAGVAFVGS
jgi:hypothetical protein